MKTQFFDFLYQDTALDVLRAVLGHEIGEGIDRRVFEMNFAPEVVCKIENTVTERFQNIIEFRTWNELCDTTYGKWLAPVKGISTGGQALFMAKTTAIPKGKLPAKMPKWLSDFKPDNYGLYEGRVVCHDYGTNLILRNGPFSMGQRLKKVDWRT